MSVIFSKCFECKYFHLDNKLESGKVTCDAFPEKIPIEVFKSDESVKCTDKISFEKNEADF